MATFDRNRHLRTIADDIRRTRDTVEKLNEPAHQKLWMAAQHLQEAAALISDVAGAPPQPAADQTLRFGR